MEITIDKSIPENAAMLKGCKVGQMVDMKGKIVDDNDEEATVAVSSLYKSKAVAEPEAEAVEPEEAEAEAEAPVAKKSGGPMAYVLGVIGKKKR